MGNVTVYSVQQERLCGCCGQVRNEVSKLLKFFSEKNYDLHYTTSAVLLEQFYPIYKSKL